MKIPKVGEFYRIELGYTTYMVRITEVENDRRVYFKYLDMAMGSFRNLDYFYEVNNAVLILAYDTPLWRLLND